MTNLDHSSRLKFGPYLADFQAGELHKDGRRIRLQPKPSLILAALTARPGTVVTREELQTRLWPNRVYGDFDTGLNTAVKKLREALCDDPTSPRYIETIPKRGYRFLQPVETVPNSSDALPLQTPEGSLVNEPAVRAATSLANVPSRSYRRMVSAAVALALTIGAGAAAGWKYLRPKKALPESSRLTLIVLPFRNLTSDSNEDLRCDAFTEEMISRFGQIGDQHISVIATSSSMAYRNSPKSIRDIQQDLGVTHVLEGSIRKSGEDLLVTIQLIRASDQTQLWTREYKSPPNDLFELNAPIVESIIEETDFSHGAPRHDVAPAASGNPKAGQLYRSGRKALEKRTAAALEEAADDFRAALRLEPDSAAAFSGLADSYSLLIFYGYSPPAEGVPRARAAAREAVNLDESLAEAHVSLGYVDFMWDLDWTAAEKEFERAISLDATYVPAHHWYALCLSFEGRHHDARQQLARARQLDPSSLILMSASAWLSYFEDDYKSAAQQALAVLARDPNFHVAHTILGLAREQQGRADAAIPEFRKLVELTHGQSPVYLDYLGHAYAVAGRHTEAHAILRRLEEERSPVASYEAATLAALGRRSEALDALERGFDELDVARVLLKVDPRYASLRQENRYERLLRHAGLASNPAASD